MTQPRDPNSGFASRMSNHLWENRYIYHATVAGLVAGTLLHRAGRPPLTALAAAVTAPTFMAANKVFNTHAKENPTAAILGSSGIAAVGFGAVALAVGGRKPLAATALITGFAGSFAGMSAMFRQNLDLAKRFGEARLPGTVKQGEAPFVTTKAENGAWQHTPTTGPFKDDQVGKAELHLNAGYHDLTEQGGDFHPQKGTKYLWVVREDGHLIVGNENPGQPDWNAFAGNLAQVRHPDPGIQRNLDESVRGIQDLGHPTLAARFDGDVLRAGKGRIGGELFENENGEWTINNFSGRYGKNREDPPKLLENAAQEFRIHGVDVRHIKCKGIGGPNEGKVVPLEVSAMNDLTHLVGNRINRLVKQIGELAGVDNHKPGPPPPPTPPTPSVQPPPPQAPRVTQ